MELGIVFPQHEIGVDAGAIRDFAQGAEALGFTHMLVYDHILGADRDRPGGFTGPYDKDTSFHEPFVLFGFMAACTTTIEFATSVLVLPQRQTALVAKQTAEADILSGGRIRLGIGTGWNAVEYESLGENFHNRGRRQAEQVELLRALWTNDVVDYAGRWHRVPKAGINPLSGRTIPIWFGGGAPAALDRAAKLGDGWFPLGGPNEASRAMIERLHEGLRANGRDIGAFGIQAQAQVRGGNPERWATHAGAWRNLGATHLAIATMSAGLPDIDAHLKAAQEWKASVAAAADSIAQPRTSASARCAMLSASSPCRRSRSR